VLLDGAHNPEGARSLAHHLDTLKRPVHLVYGVLGDKDYRGMVDLLGSRAASMSLVPPSSPRALAPEKLLPLVDRHPDAQAYATVTAGLEAAQAKAVRDGGLVVVAGSLYLVGEARRLLRPR
jgi:dihydrofolate synthase/folylpolyglutamate synthase